MAKILIIDDDELIRKSLSRLFSGLGHEVIQADSLADGLARADIGADVIFLDLGLPDGKGQEAIDRLAATPGNPEIIVITGLGNNYGAEETLIRGAWDYIRKPASPAEVRTALDSALSYRRESGSDTGQRNRYDDCGMIGKDPSMVRVVQQISRSADSEANILILGETGVGKELAARAVHANSSRRNKPFIVVDCSNLTETLVESILYGHVKGAFTGAGTDGRGLVSEADGGTLFLDEVGELPMELQKSFLRVLQEKRFRPIGAAKEKTSDFRLVAATNRNLETMSENGHFRSDLFFRLRTVAITIPALRDRGDDILRLAEHFVQRSCQRYRLQSKSLSRQLTAVLLRYTWPGNVRELGNAMEAAVIEAGQTAVLVPKHLPGHIRLSLLDPPARRKEHAQDYEHPAPPVAMTEIPSYKKYKSICDTRYFRQLMDACNYDVTRASHLAGLSVPSIYRQLGQAGIPTKTRRNR